MARERVFSKADQVEPSEVKSMGTAGIPRCEDCGVAEIDTSYLPTLLCRQCFRKRLQAVHDAGSRDEAE
jgi:ribosomal protein S14